MLKQKLFFLQYLDFEGISTVCKVDIFCPWLNENNSFLFLSEQELYTGIQIITLLSSVLERMLQIWRYPG